MSKLAKHRTIAAIVRRCSHLSLFLRIHMRYLGRTAFTTKCLSPYCSVEICAIAKGFCWRLQRAVRDNRGAKSFTFARLM